MNLIEAFVAHLESINVGTAGEDIFIGEAPSSAKAADSLWWLVPGTAAGGALAERLITGESMKPYPIDIFYRNQSGKVVYDTLFALEEQLTCSGCVQLDGFDTVDIATLLYPSDNDLDSENRKVGLLQVTISVYKECSNVIS